MFLPVLFVQEEAGQLFRDIALAISCRGGAVADRLGDGHSRRPPRGCCASDVEIAPRAARRTTHPTGPKARGRLAGQRRRTASRPNGRSTGRSSASLQTSRRRRHRWRRSIAGSSVRRRSRRLAICCLGSWFSRLGVVGVLVGVAGRWHVSALAEGRIPADRQPQPGVRHPAAAAGLQPRPAHGRWARRSRRDLQPYWDVDPGQPRAAKLDYPGDRRLLLRGPRPAGVPGSAGARPAQAGDWSRWCAKSASAISPARSPSPSSRACSSKA